MTELVENIKELEEIFRKFMKKYENIHENFEEICGKYGGILPTIYFEGPSKILSCPHI